MTLLVPALVVHLAPVFVASASGFTGGMLVASASLRAGSNVVLVASATFRAGSNVVLVASASLRAGLRASP